MIELAAELVRANPCAVLVATALIVTGPVGGYIVLKLRRLDQQINGGPK